MYIGVSGSQSVISDPSRASCDCTTTYFSPGEVPIKWRRRQLQGTGTSEIPEVHGNKEKPHKPRDGQMNVASTTYFSSSDPTK